MSDKNIFASGGVFTIRDMGDENIFTSDGVFTIRKEDINTYRDIEYEDDIDNIEDYIDEDDDEEIDEEDTIHISKMANDKIYFAKVMNVTNKLELEKLHQEYLKEKNSFDNRTSFYIKYKVPVEDALGEMKKIAIVKDGAMATDRMIPIHDLLLMLGKINHEAIFRNLKVKNIAGEPIQWLNSEKHSKKTETIIEYELYSNRSKGGRKPKLTIKEMIDATVEILLTNKTYLELSKKYKLSESNMFETINRVIKVLSEKEILCSNYCPEIVIDFIQLIKVYKNIEQLTK